MATGTLFEMLMWPLTVGMVAVLFVSVIGTAMWTLVALYRFISWL